MTNKKHRIALIVICSILAVVLTVMVAGAVYFKHLMGKIGRTEDTTLPSLSQEEIDAIENPNEIEEEATAPEVKPEEIIWEEEPVEVIGGDHVVNILLIGQDRRPGEGRARSDAMILCTFNKNKQTLTMTSLMRDLYVQIPGYSDNKLNAAYQLGGMELLNETLALNFGITVDGNVEVDFSQFAQIIDLLGGVEIYLTEAEANHMNKNTEWNLTEGSNYLNGAQALSYSRIRYIGNADYGRTNRQRKILSSLISAYKNTSITTMLMVLDDILPLITTDMTDREIIKYATELFPLLATSEINTSRIPADGTFYEATVRGMSVLVPDLEANRQILKEILAP